MFDSILNHLTQLFAQMIHLTDLALLNIGSNVNLFNYPPIIIRIFVLFYCPIVLFLVKYHYIRIMTPFFYL